MKHKLNRSKLATLFVAGVLASPILVPAVSFAASNTASTTVTATINSVISISSAGPVSFSITPVSGGAQSSASDTVTVNTNNAAGYTLSIASSSANTNLVSGANNIAASSNTYASPAALTNNTWGYATPGGSFSASYAAQNNATSDSYKWAGMPASASPQIIKSTSSTATNDTTVVWYSAKADTTNPNGNYAATVTYTAATK